MLAAAARRWRTDAALRDELPGAARLAPATVAAAVAIAADAIADPDALCALVDRELGALRPPPAWLAAHVLASNVPALAVPAIVLGCLAGVATLAKSGRADQVSAPAFHRALAAEDPELAATVVPAYWPGGDRALEDRLLAAADVIVATGHDQSVAAITRRFGRRVVGHGERASVVVLGREALAGTPALAASIAADVALHDQRGCLSPQTVYVDGDPHAFAEALVAALDIAAGTLPPGPLDSAERAAHRTAVAAAEWDGATVHAGAGGTVLVDERGRTRASPGRRTVCVHPLAPLAGLLPTGRIECVGLAGTRVDLELLRRLGVSRVCPPGRMQRPPLAWPRGQRPPLRTLLRGPTAPELLVEAT